MLYLTHGLGIKGHLGSCVTIGSDVALICRGGSRGATLFWVFVLWLLLISLFLCIPLIFALILFLSLNDGVQRNTENFGKKSSPFLLYWHSRLHKEKFI